jgi:methionine-S-sulfoxide reductase
VKPAEEPSIVRGVIIEGRSVPFFVAGVLVGAFVAAAACAETTPGPTSEPSTRSGTEAAAPPPETLAVATFAGGCFWCMEPAFEKLDGVKSVVSGYTGGEERHPTYKQVGYGQTGHAEAVRVVYDPEKVSYETLLDQFWRSIDPTDAGGQFADRGRHYRTAIFFHDEAQKEAAVASKAALEEDGPFEAPIVTDIEPATKFWVAEDYHQDYYRKNPDHYARYRRGSGRGPFLEKIWGDAHPGPDAVAARR